MHYFGREIDFEKNSWHYFRAQEKGRVTKELMADYLKAV